MYQMGILNTRTYVYVLIINNEINMTHVDLGCRIWIYVVPGCGFHHFIQTEMYLLKSLFFEVVILLPVSCFSLSDLSLLAEAHVRPDCKT